MIETTVALAALIVGVGALSGLFDFSTEAADDATEDEEFEEDLPVIPLSELGNFTSDGTQSEGIATADTVSLGTDDLETHQTEGDEMGATAGGDLVEHDTRSAHEDGKSGAEALAGSSGEDFLIGMSGDDFIHGGPDADSVYAGAGNDIAHGNSGDDLVFGLSGDDSLFGGVGNDEILGGWGADSLVGGDGGDRLSGGSGEDVILGREGNDVLLGESGNDVLQGGLGDDTLVGAHAGSIESSVETDHDFLNAGSGNDVILAGDGDVVSSGSGDDVIIFMESKITGDIVEVTDYDADHDDLIITYSEADGAIPDVSVETDAEDPDKHYILVDGHRIGSVLSAVSPDPADIKLVEEGGLAQGFA